MSVLLAKLIQTTARTANAAVHGLAHKRAVEGANKQSDKPGCTPCEAMARRAAAERIVGGVRG